ncbi:MAG: ribonuclease HIII [bacterium]
MIEQVIYTIGVDESGKGDFYGPLVIAAAAISELEMPLLDELYVRDSKKLTDQRVLKVAARLVREIPCEVVTIMPSKYNELYEKIRNLNRLLAWGHARAAENLLDKVKATKMISDQFARADVLEGALMEKARGVELLQATGGESFAPVAAASIIARAEFLQRLQQLESKWGMKLPKGAGPQVDQQGKAFLGKWGVDKLGEVAKLHFKNVRKIDALVG